MSSKVRLILFAIIAVGALLRGAYLIELSHQPDFRYPGLDAGYHDYWARAIAFDQWAPPPDQMDPQIRTQPFFRPPGYPYLLALIYQITGGSYFGARVIQGTLGLLNLWLGFWFMRRWYGDAAGLLTAAISAVYWSFLYYEGELLEPVVLIAFTWGLMIALGEWKRSPTPARAAIAGVIIGLFALARPNILVTTPFLAAWMAAQTGWGGPASRRLIVNLGAIGLASLLTLLPATLRNWAVAQDLVLISSNGGVNLLMGQDADAVADHASATTGHWNCFEYPRLIAKASAEAGRPLKASEVSRWYGAQAWEQMIAHPERTLRLIALKTLLFWGPREVSNNKVEAMERDHSSILRRLPIPFSLLAGFGTLGFILEVRRRRRGDGDPRWAMSGLLGIFIVLYFASFLPYIAAGQYRMPVIPLLAGFTAVAWVEIAGQAASGRRVTALIWLAVGGMLWGLFSINITGYQLRPERWHLARAIAAERGNQLDLAEQEYRQALNLAPELDVIPARLGTLYARQEKIPEAIEQFERALVLDPGNPVTHFNLGLALALQGNVTGAIPQFVATIEQQPDHADAHYNLSIAYQMTGEPEKALEHRRRTVELRKTSQRP